MAQASIKREAHELVDELSDDATWEDLLREVALRRAIEEGLEDAEAPTFKHSRLYPSWNGVNP